MNNFKNKPLICLLALLISVSGSYQAKAAKVEPQTLYYGVEINGVLCGYSEISISSMVKDGKDMTLLKQKVFAMLSALGSKFNTELNTIDAAMFYQVESQLLMLIDVQVAGEIPIIKKPKN